MGDLIRNYVRGLIPNELVTVQPLMSQPTGNLFYLDYQYSFKPIDKLEQYKEILINRYKGNLNENYGIEIDCKNKHLTEVYDWIKYKYTLSGELERNYMNP